MKIIISNKFILNIKFVEKNILILRKFAHLHPPETLVVIHYFYVRKVLLKNFELSETRLADSY